VAEVQATRSFSRIAIQGSNALDIQLPVVLNLEEEKSTNCRHNNNLFTTIVEKADNQT